MVVFYLDLRQTGNFLNKDTAHARHIFYHFLHFACLLSEHVQIITKYLDSHILLDTCQQLIVAHLNGLRNLSFQSRNGTKGFLHLLHQFWSSLGRGPFSLRFQCNHDVSTFYRHRVGRNLSTTYSAYYLLDLRIFLLEQLFSLATTLHHLRQ